MHLEALRIPLRKVQLILPRAAAAEAIRTIDYSPGILSSVDPIARMDRQERETRRASERSVRQCG